MKRLSLIFSLLIGFNLFVWADVLSHARNEGLNIHFLDVGQGDSSLVSLPGGEVNILIDGGRDKAVLSELSKVLPGSVRYLDLVILTHADLDHFGGLTEVFKRYKVGAFIYNGLPGKASAWPDLEKALTKNGARVIVLSEGDKIRHRESAVGILSPGEEFLGHKNINETGIVALLLAEESRTLFTGDIGFAVEEYLSKKYKIKADILQVGHHGSRYSSGEGFLNKVSPAVSLISVGKNNYGHPSPDAVSRIERAGGELYRTDTEGTIHLNIKGGKVRIYSL